MEITKKVRFFNDNTINVIYYETKQILQDSMVYRYDDYKISLRLTDGLFGVLGTKVMGGKKGDIFLFSPDEIHFGRFATSELQRYIHIFIPVDLCNNLEREYPSLKKIFDASSPNRINCIRGDGKLREKIIEIGESIVANIKNTEDKNFDITIDILQLLLICEQLYHKENIGESPAFSSITQQAIEYISNHYNEKTTVEKIADNLGYSGIYLAKKFKKDTGKSIYTYITEYRISKSTIFLKEGYNVTETCYSVGFGDCSNFIRTFKKVIGISPYKYKKLEV